MTMAMAIRRMTNKKFRTVKSHVNNKYYFNDTEKMNYCGGESTIEVAYTVQQVKPLRSNINLH